MCGGGGGGNAFQAQQQQEQLQQQAAASAAQLAEQQREFDVQQKQSADSLANTKALQDRQQAESDRQAGLTSSFQENRARQLAQGTYQVNQAFSQFTPDYYSKFTKDYTDHYTPDVEKQFGLASNNTAFGLARTGNLDSQTAADQFQNLDEQRGTALADVNNQAIGATNTLRTNVVNAKQNLIGQVASDATLGSPVTPGSADAVQNSFDNTTAALKNITSNAGDVTTTLQATPQYSSMGSLFGGLAQAGSSAIQGNNTYGNLQAYNAGLAGTGPSNATSPSSARVR